MVTKAHEVKQGSLDHVRAFREISAAKSLQGDKAKRVSGYKTADARFGKFAGTGPIRAGRFATSAQVATSTGPKGSSHRVELLTNVLSNPNPTEHEGNLLAMALKDSISIKGGKYGKEMDKRGNC